MDAAKLGLIVPLLVGPRDKIEATARKFDIDLGNAEIVDAEHSHAAASRAVELVRERRAEALMKGSLHTDELMGAVVRRETGLRTARRVSHCFVMDVPSYSETLIVTDAAINIAPSIMELADIIQNAIDLAHACKRRLMCAAGSLYVNLYGYPTLIVKLINFLCWPESGRR